MLPQSTLIKTLSSVQPGDIVVTRNCRPNWYQHNTASVTRVDRVTKTQIIAGGTRYRKDTGREVGYDWKYSHCYREILTKTENGITRLLTPEEGQAVMNAAIDKFARKELASKLSSLNREYLASLPLDTLKQVAALVGLE